MKRLPSFNQSTISREASASSNPAKATSARRSRTNNGQVGDEAFDSTSDQSSLDDQPAKLPSLIGNFAARDTTERTQPVRRRLSSAGEANGILKDKQKLVRKFGKENDQPPALDEFDDTQDPNTLGRKISRPVEDFNTRLAENAHEPTRDCDVIAQPDDHEVRSPLNKNSSSTAPTASIVQSAFDRMRPRRKSPEVATITIGSKTTTSILGSSVCSQRKTSPTPSTSSKPRTSDTSKQQFSSSMRAFAAPGSELIQTVGLPQSKALPNKIRPIHQSDSGSEDALEDDDEDDEQGSDDERPQAEVSELADEASVGSESDDDYVDEDEKKALEEARVAKMIEQAEEAASMPSEDRKRRAQQALKGSNAKDSTTELVQRIGISIEKIKHNIQSLQAAIPSIRSPPHPTNHTPSTTLHTSPSDSTVPDRLTLTVTKSDFPSLHIIGQFNLGFILATRAHTDLFIIDQHASDEKINFERLQATTTMQNQRLVHPLKLHLTAADEEIVLENQDILLRNGFVVDIDTTGSNPVGQRIALLSLPMSKETTFSPSDLEELIALLADSPPPPPLAAGSSARTIPRPSRIRRLLAMRACRSSVMIGKVMNKGIMRRLVGRMGQIDKPWNCPHGRPTMRHVCGLEGVGGWVGGPVGEDEGGEGADVVDWRGWIEGLREADGGEAEDDGTSEEMRGEEACDCREEMEEDK